MLIANTDNCRILRFPVQISNFLVNRSSTSRSTATVPPQQSPKEAGKGKGGKGNPVSLIILTLFSIRLRLRAAGETFHQECFVINGNKNQL